jgi:hypothetical protein
MTTKNRAAVSLGRRGGKATSDRKAAASRENGKKGGRPKKEQTMTTIRPGHYAKGQYVRAYFDTGAMGAEIIYGVVVAAGPRAFTVRWEGGNTNRCRQGEDTVTRVTERELKWFKPERLGLA